MERRTLRAIIRAQADRLAMHRLEFIDHGRERQAIEHFVGVEHQHALVPQRQARL